MQKSAYSFYLVIDQPRVLQRVAMIERLRPYDIIGICRNGVVMSN